MNMNDIYIEGGTKRQKKLTQSVIEFAIRKLLPRVRTLLLDVSITNHCKDLGGCWLLDDYKTCGMELNKSSSTKDFIISILHEMVHVKQFYRKELIEKLVFTFNHSFVQRVYWKGRDCTDIEYKNLPYEQEAYDMSMQLYKEWKNE
tara:strand:- start:36 stop:473 length:438 start_codon:yes stop_codon:yes gene_type:complete